MRYFLNSLTGDEITQEQAPYDKGKLKLETLPIYIEWKNEDGTNFKSPKQKLIKTLDNGSQIYEEVEQNNEGEWLFFSLRTGKKEYINKDKIQEFEINPQTDKSQTHELTEQVYIYTPFSADEQAEYDKKEKERKQKEKEQQEHVSYLDNIEVTVEGLKTSDSALDTKVETNQDDTDKAITEIYKLLDKKENKNSDVSYIAKAYARLIKRGIITMDDVPEDLREEVKKWL